MRVLAYSLMPNHFHLVLWPSSDGELGTWMQWLMTSHVRRHHRHYQSSGHVWQGRFKAFPIEEDDHLRVVVRQNIALALGTKALVLALAVFGLATLWMAILADVGTSLLVTANATSAPVSWSRPMRCGYCAELDGVVGNLNRIF